MSNALVIVDVQKDFCESGAVGADGGNSTAESIALYVRQHGNRYNTLIVTTDWHNNLTVDRTGNGGHFAIAPNEPDYQKTWPTHCVGGTAGAELHQSIVNALDGLNPTVIRKGQGVPGYSGFDGSAVQPTHYRGAALLPILRSLKITDIDVCGLVYEQCVYATGRDALAAGFNVRILRNLTVVSDAERAADLDSEATVQRVDI